MIDYILYTTRHEKMYYIGHSEGTTQFWVMASEKPEYNSKISLMIGLAPAAFSGNIRGPIRKLAKLTYFGVVRESSWKHSIWSQANSRQRFLLFLFYFSVGRRDFWLSGIPFAVRLGKIRVELILPERSVHAIHLQQYPVSGRGIQSCGIKYGKSEWHRYIIAPFFLF